MDPASDEPEGQRDEGHEDDGDEGELQRYPQHRDDRESERHGRGDDVHHAGALHHPGRREIVRHAGHEIADPLVLEVAEVHPLEVGEEVVPHVVLDEPRGVHHEVAAGRSEHGLQAGEQEGEERQSHDRVDRRAAVQAVDELADETRGYDGSDRASRHGERAEEELGAVAADVVEIGGAGRRHVGRILVRGVRINGHIPEADSTRGCRRVARPPTHAMRHATAPPANTGATTYASATGPTRRSGAKLNTDTSMLRTPKMRPRICSWRSDCSRVIDGTVMNAYEIPNTNAVRLTSATKNGKPAVGPVAPRKSAASGRSAARMTSAAAVTRSPVAIARCGARRPPMTFSAPRPATTPR